MINGFEYFSNKDETREQIKFLLQNYKFSLESLSKITGLDFNMLTNYINQKNDLPILEKCQLSTTTSMLSEGIKMVKEDDRIKGVIDVLVSIFEINYETIAIYAGIELEELQSFMLNPNSISYEKRYKLATTSLFLHYLFKKPPQVIKEE